MLTQQVGLRQQSLNDQIVAGEGLLGDGYRTSRHARPEPKPNPEDDEQGCCRKSSALLCDLAREGWLSTESLLCFRNDHLYSLSSIRKLLPEPCGQCTDSQMADVSPFPTVYH